MDLLVNDWTCSSEKFGIRSQNVKGWKYLVKRKICVFQQSFDVKKRATIPQVSLNDDKNSNKPNRILFSTVECTMNSDPTFSRTDWRKNDTNHLACQNVLPLIGVNRKNMFFIVCIVMMVNFNGSKGFYQLPNIGYAYGQCILV